uniref:C3H1-type domain-containing protein n=1 Tax=Scleropages formosus TaxID=113540 RepID=A0A8C9W7K8_SCLFO
LDMEERGQKIPKKNKKKKGKKQDNRVEDRQQCRRVSCGTAQPLSGDGINVHVSRCTEFQDCLSSTLSFPQGRVNGPPSFVKKQPYLSQEFISQHAIQRDGRLFCKFFLSGRCIKEEACKFEHEFVVPDKKQELCKFYVLGFCTKGADCIYMHNDYPCKFFHTGTKCYQGDHCKFSHDPLTEVTRPLLEKVVKQ